VIRAPRQRRSTQKGDPAPPLACRPTRTRLAILTVLAAIVSAAPAAHAAAWPGCKAFTDQTTAQATWEASGKPAGADGDADGKVCERLPTTAPTTPTEQTPSSPAAALPAQTPAPAPGTVTSRVSPLHDRRGVHPGLTAVPKSQRARARRLIARVRTAPAGSRTGYSRDAFGSAWTDDTTITWGHDNCKTREQILRRDLRSITYRPNTNSCVVLTGILRDPYTATTITFAKARPLAVQIDHVMPLAYDWSQGAATWTRAKRKQIANDPLNLLAVDGHANTHKAASGPANWLPPNTRVRCAYAVRFAQVSRKYKLTIRPQDKRTMLKQCRAS
jgi:Protein of unknown function (DUF1524)